MNPRRHEAAFGDNDRFCLCRRLGKVASAAALVLGLVEAEAAARAPAGTTQCFVIAAVSGTTDASL